MSRERLYLFDTTLRDGALTTGVDFNLDDKRNIAAMLDRLGVFELHEASTRHRVDRIAGRVRDEVEMKARHGPFPAGLWIIAGKPGWDRRDSGRARCSPRRPPTSPASYAIEDKSRLPFARWGKALPAPPASPLSPSFKTTSAPPILTVFDGSVSSYTPF